jgi:hypothetical protein
MLGDFGWIPNRERQINAEIILTVKKNMKGVSHPLEKENLFSSRNAMDM